MKPEPRPDPSETSLLYDWFVATQHIRRLLAGAMTGAPLTSEDYAAYSAVLEFGPMPPTSLARRLGAPLTTVLDLVRTMEERGHLERTRNPNDGRSYLVSLTSAGRRLHLETNRYFEVAMSRLLDNMSVPESQARAVVREVGRAAAEAEDDVAASASGIAG